MMSCERRSRCHIEGGVGVFDCIFGDIKIVLKNRVICGSTRWSSAFRRFSLSFSYDNSSLLVLNSILTFSWRSRDLVGALSKFEGLFFSQQKNVFWTVHPTPPHLSHLLSSKFRAFSPCCAFCLMVMNIIEEFF